jgi:hypothetical protein
MVIIESRIGDGHSFGSFAPSPGCQWKRRRNGVIIAVVTEFNIVD